MKAKIKFLKKLTFFLGLAVCCQGQAFTTFEYSLPRTPEIYRESNWPASLSFQDIDPISTQDFRSLLSDSPWHVGYLCDGAPVSADTFSKIELNNGVTDPFATFDFSDRFRMRKSSGGMLSLFFGVANPRLWMLAKYQQPADLPFLYLVKQIGDNLFQMNKEGTPLWIVRPMRVQENGDIVIEYEDDSTRANSLGACGPSKILKVYLIREISQTS